jgi:hypothetical protein
MDMDMSKAGGPPTTRQTLTQHAAGSCQAIPTTQSFRTNVPGQLHPFIQLDMQRMTQGQTAGAASTHSAHGTGK